MNISFHIDKQDLMRAQLQLEDINAEVSVSDCALYFTQVDTCNSWSVCA